MRVGRNSTHYPAKNKIRGYSEERTWLNLNFWRATQTCLKVPVLTWLHFHCNSVTNDNLHFSQTGATPLLHWTLKFVTKESVKKQSLHMTFTVHLTVQASLDWHWKQYVMEMPTFNSMKQSPS
jgi:hypothetical protein